MNMHTPISTTYTRRQARQIAEERPAYIGAARLAERRLKAALHRTQGRKDVVSLYRRLRRARRMNERPIVLGPYPECAHLRRFMLDYGAAIAGVCRSKLPSLGQPFPFERSNRP
jgi:hypothetical protein